MHYIPDPTKALAYDVLFLEKDGIAACGHYIANKWNVQHVLTFPNAPERLYCLVLSGYTEPQAHVALYADFGFAIPLEIPQEKAKPAPKAKRRA
ncbi:hypothetical protein [Pseudomonas haemolytica]|uniref:hypothetical protein n=1 Tax=Pseudomonas haemolytica TaxID=2600065 RepID=UPI00190D0245|nr:hypothetical protein [Pseudomonas haemolytica]MBK3450821.1 hypothetical protein [Pseudomonas haemolytica]